MVDRARLERLQPALLDRLIDDAPDQRIETNAAWIIDINRLRDIIQRDLHWLLNTTNLQADTDLGQFPEAARSVLNFGIADVSGITATNTRAIEIQQAIRVAIEQFEPRLLPNTLEVVIHEQKDVRGGLFSFDIRAELWAEPVPLDLYLRTQLDVTTGEVTVHRQG
ncbi:type VI secretion system baseplate subunit TssE [uncultured Tateyamaria sp.]|uniref:type VI secretion system baseplate subunit TssE n=1 Tax=uncultured Tateyamaria sp. TaxID=455651 RepID=UPI00262981A1|nr:type VI secretion system baseplate subunit TssE [uncultured Tateyamaria sp.]